MADLAPTSIALGSQQTRWKLGQAGEAIAEMDIVFLSTTSLKYFIAGADAGVENAKSAGIALLGAALDGFFPLVFLGPVILGGITADIGDAYYLSRTLGKIMPQADLQAGDRVSYLAGATAANVLDFSIKNYLTLLA